MSINLTQPLTILVVGDKTTDQHTDDSQHTEPPSRSFCETETTKPTLQFGLGQMSRRRLQLLGTSSATISAVEDLPTAILMPVSTTTMEYELPVPEVRSTPQRKLVMTI